MNLTKLFLKTYEPYEQHLLKGTSKRQFGFLHINIVGVHDML